MLYNAASEYLKKGKDKQTSKEDKELFNAEQRNTYQKLVESFGSRLFFDLKQEA